MKILNLYAGIGGNRKLWDEVADVEVTAVEIVPEIADVYQELFPDDAVIVGDAHQYLLEHYDDGWDFIWSSPPCQSHSRIRYALGVVSGKTKAVYPDMQLWQEIIFLDAHFHGKYCVENVVPYYPPLIAPMFKSNKNYLWSNFYISKIDTPTHGITTKTIQELRDFHGFDLSGFDIDEKRILRNCVHPDLGKHVLRSAIHQRQLTITSDNKEKTKQDVE